MFCVLVTPLVSDLCAWQDRSYVWDNVSNTIRRNKLRLFTRTQHRFILIQIVPLPARYIFLPVLRPSGPGSSVRIATGYGLDRPGIESRWGRDFPHLSRPALGPTQPPVQWVSGLSRGKERPGRDADPSTPFSAVVKKE